jgi:hypothetical protein
MCTLSVGEKIWIYVKIWIRVKNDISFVRCFLTREISFLALEHKIHISLQPSIISSI